MRKLYDSPEDELLTADPYNMFEDDLKYCRASESSLWELLTVTKAGHERLYKSALFLKKTSAADHNSIIFL